MKDICSSANGFWTSIRDRTWYLDMQQPCVISNRCKQGYTTRTAYIIRTLLLKTIQNAIVNSYHLNYEKKMAHGYAPLSTVHTHVVLMQNVSSDTPSNGVWLPWAPDLCPPDFSVMDYNEMHNS
jgi:hypothetical protein